MNLDHITWTPDPIAPHGPCRLCEREDGIYEASMVISDVSIVRGNPDRLIAPLIFLICQTCYRNFVWADNSQLDDEYCHGHDPKLCPAK